MWTIKILFFHLNHLYFIKITCYFQLLIFWIGKNILQINLFEPSQIKIILFMSFHSFLIFPYCALAEETTCLWKAKFITIILNPLHIISYTVHLVTTENSFIILYLHLFSMLGLMLTKFYNYCTFKQLCVLSLLTELIPV